MTFFQQGGTFKVQTDIYDFSIQKSPLIPGYNVLRDSFTLSFDLRAVGFSYADNSLW